VDNSSLPESRPDPLKKSADADRSRPYADPALELRASDADRERVAEALREAYAEGRLTAEEHAERVDAVYASKTMGDLVPLTRDLPAHSEVHRSSPTAAPASSARPSRSDLPPARQEDPKMIAVFGGAERRGRFRAGALLRAVAVFGGVEIDLSEAVFDQPELVIHCTAVFGGVDIKVPDHVTLRGGGVGIFGGSDVKQQEGEGPSAPVVTVRTVCVFGGVSAERKKSSKLKAALRKHLEG
jgi:Domain of unknown function (DUF1707)/Cell wall-active antibiotics response 4TMS YvqF